MFYANDGHLLSDILARNLTTDSFAEDSSNLLARFVDNGHDHMRRALVIKLRDPFAQIGLHRLNATSFEIGIEFGLFTDHRLGLDDQIDSLAVAEFINIAIGIFYSTRLVDNRSGVLSICFKLRHQFRLMLNSIVFGITQHRAQIDKTILWTVIGLFSGKGTETRGTPVRSETAKSGLQIFVLQSALETYIERLVFMSGMFFLFSEHLLNGTTMRQGILCRSYPAQLPFHDGLLLWSWSIILYGQSCFA